jgi:hypothetical protein
MADCEQFTVTVKDVDQTLQKVQDAVKKNGGTFKGDKTKGSFSASGKIAWVKSWSVKGEYTVSGNKISIKNTVDGLSCSTVSGEIQDWFK